MRKEHSLADEVRKIRSNAVRRFVYAALDNADPEFWEAPCSSSGRYHPYEDQGEGGLIRHLKKGVAVVGQFARRARFSEYDTDLAVAGVILHDIKKDGEPWSGRTTHDHGIAGSNWLEQFPLKDKSGKRTILDAVRYHMAPWCYVANPWEKDKMYTQEELIANQEELIRALMHPTRIELAVREGDYWGSRQSMSFLPGKSVVHDPRLHDTPEEWLESIKKPY